MKSISVNTLCEELLSSDLYTNVDTYDLNEFVKCYSNTLRSPGSCDNNTLDRQAPVINKTITKRPTVPWFTNEVKSAKRIGKGLRGSGGKQGCIMTFLSSNLEKTMLPL